MTQQKEDYSPDFEEDVSVSTASADTSQFIQSEENELDYTVDEGLDESMSIEFSDKIKLAKKNDGETKVGSKNPMKNEKLMSNEGILSEDGGPSEAASTSKSTADALEAVTKFLGNSAENEENSATPDMAEIENIMKKLEKLEKAQSVLESSLNLDWMELSSGNPAIPPNSHLTPFKPPSVKVKEKESLSEAVCAELNSVEELIRQEDLSQRERSKRFRQDSSSASIVSVGVGDRSLEDVLKEYDEFEQSISADLDDIVKPIPTSNFSIEDHIKTQSPKSKPTVPLEPPPEPIPSTSVEFRNNNNTEETITKNRKTRPKSAGKSLHRAKSQQNFAEKFNELVNSELLKQDQSLVNSQVSIPKGNYKGETTNKPKLLERNYSSISVPAPQEIEKSRRNPHISVNRIKNPFNADNLLPENIIQPLSRLGAGDGNPTLEEIFASSPEIGSGASAYIIEKLKNEISRQESLIDAYQKDSQKLYSQLKKSQESLEEEKAKYKEEVNSLKTEIATLKVNRLAQSQTNSSGSPLFGSMHKIELERVQQESAAKTELITDLRREILLLRNTQAPRPVSGKKAKEVALSEEKENEYQKTIRNLNKQVRTLQKILYSKDPNVAAAILQEQKDRGDNNPVENPIPLEKKSSQVPILENRVVQLEQELAKVDSDAKEKLKDFQQKLHAIKTKYEDRIENLEKKLSEASEKAASMNPTVSRSPSQELNVRLQKSQQEINNLKSEISHSKSEISHLKVEISRYKREQEITVKGTSNPVTSVTKQDSATLSLAIKSFKSELADKEKEILKMRKEVADLRKTNVNLKKEREKYLNGTNNTGGNNLRILKRAKTDISPSKVDSGIRGVVKKPNSAPKVPTATAHILKAALESERQEFERIIDEKSRHIAEQEKQIAELRSKIKAREREFLGGEIGDTKKIDMSLVDQLRNRVMTQNKVITALKEHISSFKTMEREFANWNQEKQRLQFRNMELAKRCAASEELRKPENEILLSLSQKVEDLDSRYHYREKQLDSLLTRLSLRTTGSSSLAAVLSPRHYDPMGNPRNLDLVDVDLHQLELLTTTGHV